MFEMPNMRGKQRCQRDTGMYEMALRVREIRALSVYVDGTEHQGARSEALESMDGKEKSGRIEVSNKRGGTSRRIERNELLMRQGNPRTCDTETSRRCTKKEGLIRYVQHCQKVSENENRISVSLAKCRLISVLSVEWNGRKFHQSELGGEGKSKWRRGILTTLSKSFVIKGSREMGLYLEGTESKDSLLV